MKTPQHQVFNPWTQAGTTASTILYGAMKRKASTATRYAKRKRVASRISLKGRRKLRFRRLGRFNQRRKRRETRAVHAEFSKEVNQRGRGLRSSLKNAWRFLRWSATPLILGLSQTSEYGGTSGSITLQNTSTTTSTGTLQVPCYMFELTAAPQTNGTTVTTYTDPDIAWRPVFSDPTSSGTVSFTPGTRWGLESIDGAPLTCCPGAKSIFSWVQAKLLCYAPTTMASKFTIQIVSFKDEQVVPSTATATTTCTAFWQTLLKQYTYSPLEPGDPALLRKMRIHFSTEFILEPKETTDVTNTNMREVDIFRRFDKLCNYKWSDTDTMGMVVNDMQYNSYAAIQNRVHPTKRLYLMIRAQSKNAAAFSSSVHPSFDIRFRVKHIGLQT